MTVAYAAAMTVGPQGTIPETGRWRVHPPRAHGAVCTGPRREVTAGTPGQRVCTRKDTRMDLMRWAVPWWRNRAVNPIRCVERTAFMRGT